LKAVQNVQSNTLARFVRMHVHEGSKIHHDEFSVYNWLNDSEFEHDSVNHSQTYVTANGTTTNGVENVWSLFKRGIVGVFHKVSGKYLQLYLDEFAFHFSNRDEYDLMDRVLASRF
jgi:transposase-like protein